MNRRDVRRIMDDLGVPLLTKESTEHFDFFEFPTRRLYRPAAEVRVQFYAPRNDLLVTLTRWPPNVGKVEFRYEGIVRTPDELVAPVRDALKFWPAAYAIALAWDNDKRLPERLREQLQRETPDRAAALVAGDYLLERGLLPK